MHETIGRVGAFLVIGATVAAVAAAQDPPRRTYTTARVVGASPVVDGRLNDEAWNAVEWTTGFTQSTPNDGARPTQETAFKILYDDENLYIGVRLYDTDPTGIARWLGRRDAYSGDDIYVMIDSYFDRRTAFGFGVNAAGVKYDAVMTSDGTTNDTSWDPVWFVATAVDQQGWTAEMRIPLSQLRFGNKPEHVWGLQVSRGYWRASENSTWQAIPQRATGRVSRFGELHGLRGVRPRTLAELVPYGVEKLQRSEKQPGNPFATGQAHSLMGGLDGKVGVTNDMTLNVTVNPDFGQVEADPSVVNLTAYETYYAEKRPFFVEGADIFTPRITSSGTSAGDVLFYSRRIGRPPQYRPGGGPGIYVDQPDQTTILGAAKISGKTRNGLTIGVLDAVTSEERATLDVSGERRDQVVEPMTNYLVGRVQQDLRGGNTMIGGMVTLVRRNLDQAHLSFLHQAAYTGGIDFTHFWQNKTYYVKGAGVFSHVRGTPEAILRTQRSAPRYFQRPDAAYLTLDPTRTSLSGHGGSVEAGRAGNSRLTINASYAWRSPGLELNDVGFQRVGDYAVLRVQGAYRVFNPFWIMRRFNVEFAPWVNFVNQTEYVGTGGYVAVNAQLRNYWSWSVMVERDTEYLDTMMLRGGPAMKTSPYTSIFGSLTSDGRKRLSVSLSGGRRWDPNREIGSANAGLTVSYRPTTALNLSVRPNWSTYRGLLQYVGTRQVGDEARYLVSSLDQQTFGLTVRLDYAVTPTLSVQYYGQPFLSVGNYTDFKRVTDPRAATFADRFLQYTPGQIMASAGQYLVDENLDGRTDLSFGNPDFAFRQFRSNLVVRWEYSPGSTLFVVWAQDRTGNGQAEALSIGSDMNALFQLVPRNVFLVKFSRRFAL